MTSRLAYVFLISAILLFVVLGTLGYMVIMDWSLLDALYMIIITVTTIGYETPGTLSPAGKAYTIVLSFMAYGLFTTFVGLITYTLVGIRFDRVIRRRRMEKQIHHLKDHYIVCGAGQIGQKIMTELVKTHHRFVVIERQRNLVESLMEEHPEILFVEGDATDNHVLERANVHRARGLICALDSDSSNVFLCLTARDLNPELRIVTRANEADSVHKMERAGADNVVSPAEIGALRMASSMIRPEVVNFLDVMIREHEMTLRMEQVAIPPGSPMEGITLADSDIRRRTGLMIIAVHSGGEFLFNPSGAHELSAGDALIILGTPDQRQQLERLVAP